MNKYIFLFLFLVPTMPTLTNDGNKIADFYSEITNEEKLLLVEQKKNDVKAIPTKEQNLIREEKEQKHKMAAIGFFIGLTLSALYISSKN